MTKSWLQPPNKAPLSDNVIGSVTLRSRPSDSHVVAETGPHPYYPSHPVRLPSLFPTRSASIAYHQELRGSGSFSLPRVGRAREEVHVVVKRVKRVQLGGEVMPTIKNVMAEEKRQRELRRLRQIRYRKKKDRLAKELDKETQQLQREVQRLKQRYAAISSAVPPKETVWNVVVQYFHLSRNGYLPKMESSTVATMGFNDHLDFLQAKMAPNVFHHCGYGPESLLKNWERISLCFDDIKYRLLSLEEGAQDSLVATTETSFTLTENTLVEAFPHLCDEVNTDNAEWCGRSELAAKLLDKRILVRGSTRFVWDCGFGWVTHIVEETDMLTPIPQILGNLEDVSAAFSGARVQPNFRRISPDKVK